MFFQLADKFTSTKTYFELHCLPARNWNIRTKITIMQKSGFWKKRHCFNQLTFSSIKQWSDNGFEIAIEFLYLSFFALIIKKNCKCLMKSHTNIQTTYFFFHNFSPHCIWILILINFMFKQVWQSLQQPYYHKMAKVLNPQISA